MGSGCVSHAFISVLVREEILSDLRKIVIPEASVSGWPAAEALRGVEMSVVRDERQVQDARKKEVFMRKSCVLFVLFLILFLVGCSPEEGEPVLEAQASPFTKQIDVFGIHVYATAGVADEKMLHAANVLAEYLDNDEDGVPDNPRVVKSLVEHNTSIIMTKDEREMHALERNSLPPGETQGLWDEETRPGGAEQGVFDAALEEILHPITYVGYSHAYPEVFGTEPGSVVARIMDEARGGHFEEVPEKYPDGAWYTYYDETCDYECQITEYLYWALTSILGAQDFPGRLEQIQEEWRYNSREKVEKGDPEIYALLTDPQYKFPTVLPDGVYKAKNFTIEKYPGE